MPAPSSDTTNELLSALPQDSFARLAPRLRRVDLVLRDVLSASDAPVTSVYFVEAGMISLVANLSDGMQAEVGIVGREGMAGLPLLAGRTTSFVEAMVQLPGRALQLDAGDFLREIDENPPFRALMLRYNEAFNAQIMQTAACNGRHELEQRLARWLLMCHDRVDGDSVSLTQELLAMMLGVHRPSVTVTAGSLQRAGLIRYGAGRITITDRTGLMAASCECYGTVRRRFDALLGSGKG